jgi:hypothetical protein
MRIKASYTSSLRPHLNVGVDGARHVDHILYQVEVKPDALALKKKKHCKKNVLVAWGRRSC